MNASKRKGDRAELEVQELLREHGLKCRRALGAGRRDDVGDIHGIPGLVVQVANYRDVARALREKIPEAEEQASRAGALAGVLFLRHRGGAYSVSMSPRVFTTLWKAATHQEGAAP